MVVADHTKYTTTNKNSTPARRGRKLIILASFLLFSLLCSASLTVVALFSKANTAEIRREALSLAKETGAWFSSQLDRAILPLFSMAQFATELDIFQTLPQQIGRPIDGIDGDNNTSNSNSNVLPYRTDLPDPTSHRNVTGVCDQPALVERFTTIAAAVKKHAQMEGILVNIQLAPDGVVCLLHPLNNTEDFPNDGEFLDSSGAVGMDLLTHSISKKIAEEAIVSGKVTVAGPYRLLQCPECDPFFIVRLPILYEDNTITVDGFPYKRWGFATALINWKALVERSGVYQQFADRDMDFQLTRTDRIFNPDTQDYDEQVVVLGETPLYSSCDGHHSVTTGLETTNNMWEITVCYDQLVRPLWKSWPTALCIVISIMIAGLAYVVLVQKQIQADLFRNELAQTAKVDTERNMTAYFAHELRNPLGAIDSALEAMPDDLPGQAQDLVEGMQLCSSFMSSIMNNLLDARKIEENKLELLSIPLSLSKLVHDVHGMLLPSVKQGVIFEVVCETGDRDWVLGDFYRIQQVFTNLVTNAIKHTKAGSITLLLQWQGDSIRFFCKDTGPGIPKNEQAKMFERFVQRGGAPGSGLGLCIAKKIVDLMGGSIRFDSDPPTKPGTACIVEFSLPLCNGPVQNSKASRDVHPIEEAISMLIVDDIKLNRTMLSRRIKKNIAPNSVVTELTTGEEALELCARETFDVIVMDQFMEEAGGTITGSEAITALRGMGSEALIIGNSGNDLDGNFIEAGADLFWTKPLPPNATIIGHLRQGMAKKTRISQ